MRRILSTLILTIVCAAASAQIKINPQVDSLFTELKEVFKPEEIKYNMSRELLHDGIGTALHQRIWIGKGHGDADEDRRMDKAIALIRHRLDNLAASSTEIYHYEFHFAGIDTIQYAINLTDESCALLKHENMAEFPAAEDVSFHYYTDKSGRYTNGNLSYGIRFNDMRETVDSTTWQYGLYDDSFRHEDFNKMIARLMKHKGVTRRKVHWLTPMPGVSKDNVAGLYYMWGNLNNLEEKKGVTRGVDYSVPVKNADLAADILRLLNDSIHNFIEANPLQIYTFYLDKDFTKNYGEHILSAQYKIDDNNYGGHYDIFITQDEDDYHFLFLDTRGSLWVPRKF